VGAVFGWFFFDQFRTRSNTHTQAKTQSERDLGPAEINGLTPNNATGGQEGQGNYWYNAQLHGTAHSGVSSILSQISK
jgi:hypothetical protein